ncbi:putative Ig domain-containing protein [Actinoallomurus purpureus]|uniref:putative Ig domain-containing protein n=1 Tax=Actinoallomurus purpureus TaxID=478114 RepID=UPI0020932BE5|nr:putative Ig domain-containing protein [Actinoallomurus purpureus]MCO6010773.1 putative Ig domain-containing protein [Actinoallomurus purpureus]
MSHGKPPRAGRVWFPVLVGLVLAGGLLACPATARAVTPPARWGSAPAAARTEFPAARALTRRACARPRYRHEMACLALIRTDVQPLRGIQHLAAPSGLAPADLRSAYALPSSGGSGQTIAIVDAYDDPNAEADLAVYRSQYGLPPCTTANGCFRKVDQNGGGSLPAADAGWAMEESLDLDMASAICPSCRLLLVEAGRPYTSDLGTAVNTAVRLGAKYVSNSYGGSESSDQTQSDAAYFDHPGVAITASSGDSGYETLYPAASRNVTAVGGTRLSRSAAARGWSESAWSGSGSGCSAYDAKPAWQTDTGCPRRTTADVSAVADPATGVAVYCTYQAGGWQVVGGTSASAPIVAGVYALAGPPPAQGYPASSPYQHRAGLFDITSGSNGACTPAYLCTAVPGYDGPTGLGTPNGLTAFRAGTGNVVSVTGPGNQTSVVGTAVSLAIRASDSASGQTLTYTASGLPAGLSINAATGQISGRPTTVGTSTVTVTARDTTGAAGSTSFAWQIVPAGCASPGNKIVNGGFENGASPWTTTPNVILANGSGETAHSGTHFAWLGGYGTAHTDSAAQTVTIPAGCRAVLSLWLHIDTAETDGGAYDTLTIKIGTRTLATYTNLNAAPGYRSVALDMSSFAGQTVTLSFTGTEDASLQTGFVIDDVALNAS